MNSKAKALVEKLIEGHASHVSFEQVQVWKKKHPDTHSAARKLARYLDGQFEFEDVLDFIEPLWDATSQKEVDKALKDDEDFLNIADVIGGLAGWSP